MKYMVCALAFVAAAVTIPAIAADVGVSVQVGEPGFYGRIDIGNFPRPQVIYPEPVVIQPVPVGAERPPIYLRVPPGHAENWSRHCHKYNACDQPVYFVHDRWYNEEYVPRHYENAGWRHAEQHGSDRGEYHAQHNGNDRGEYHDQRHGDDRGEGHDQGHGNGWGHRED